MIQKQNDLPFQKESLFIAMDIHGNVEESHM